MKASSTTSTVIFGGIAAFAAMSALGWKLADQAEGTPHKQAGNEPLTRSSERPSSASGASIPEHVRRQMSAIRATSSSAERMRLTIDLVNSIPHDEIPRWIDAGWFDLRSGFEMTLFTTLINQRWESEDPEGMIAWSLKSGNDYRGQQLLMKWSQDDPQRVFDFFAQNPNAAAESRLIPEIAKAHPSLALARIQELLAGGQVTAYVNGNLELTLRQLAEKSPGALLAALDSLPPGWQVKVETALIGERLKQDFQGELNRLLERPDGLSIFQSTVGGVDGFQDKVLAELHNMPASWVQSIADNPYMYIHAKNASKWITTDLEALGLSAQRASHFRNTALQSMAYNNPEEMFKLMGTLELDDSQRKGNIINVFSRDRSPEETDRLLALLSPDDRTFALEIQESRAQNQQGKPIEKPSEWLDRMEGVDVASGGYSAIYSLSSTLQSWDATKVAELTRQFATLPAERKDQIASVFLSADYETDRGLKGEMIRHLATQPQEPDPEDSSSNRSNKLIATASTHVVQWAQSDPEAASRWVQTLPQGEVKLWTQKNLASNWALYDPEAAGNWVKSLPADARQEVTSFMDRGE